MPAIDPKPAIAVNGTAVLMHATISGVNGGNPIAVLMECAGGSQQISPATASQHAVQLGQVAGVVGSARNLVMSVPATAGTATLTADEIIVETALGGLRYCLSTFSKSLNIATLGAGGMDAGSSPASGYLAIYAIYNPTTQTAALLATNATSSVAPNVYGAGHMPAGYTASALVSVWPTNGSGNLLFGYQTNRDVLFAPVSVLATTTTFPTTLTSLNIAAGAPPNAIRAQGNVYFLASGSPTVIESQTSPSATAIGVQSSQIAGNVSQALFAYSIPLITQQVMYYLIVLTGGVGSSLNISVTGYSF